MTFPFSESDLASFVQQSKLLAERADVERELESVQLRSLTEGEITRLASQGNSAEDWGRVRVTKDFRTKSIFGSRFEGDVTLGRLVEDEQSASGLPSGIYHSTLSDCVIGTGARVARCDRLSRYVISPGASIDGARRIGIRGDSTDFGNSLELFREELFSRRLRVVAELGFDWAAWIVGPESAEGEALERAHAYNRAADLFAAAIRSPRGFVGRGARITTAGIIENCWIGGGVEIDGAGYLRDSTIWSAPGEPTLIRDGANMHNGLVGPGCTIENACSIERSILFEHVFVGTHAVVKNSAVGPNTRLAEGETNDCLLGPYSTSIHQGLILAAWWPEGKGNIAYGSNVGSNHTGRAPDQEIFPGEGVFFGLGCNIKLPSNFREAPYTILATGIDALPQKVSFPFSVILAPDRPHEGVSPALNEIRPGWALIHNAYGLERQERQLFARNKARRTRVQPAIFRPDLLALVESALERLNSAPPSKAGLFLERNMPGLGKNFMIEEARVEAIRAYEIGLRLGAAHCLIRELARCARQEEGNSSPAIPDAGLTRWAGRLLKTEDPAEMIQSALAAETEWARLIRDSKQKDAKRGRAILDDYEQRHFIGDFDPVIVAVEQDLERHHVRADKYLALMTRAAAR